MSSSSSISKHNAGRRQALAGLAALGLPAATAVQAAATQAASAAPTAAPLRVAAKLSDAAEVASPSAVLIGGWLGERIGVNAKNRLLNVDMEPLLAGFRKKPGSHPWIGEHVGKWLHAATLAWAHTRDRALRAKLDKVAADLMATQEADGYLGTYEPGKRLAMFENADWDVWSHKYCLIGLLTYHQYTGDTAALEASKKAADLLIATFPAQRSILAAGTHQGMAATSVLEPIVLLYRISGEARYLDFARYIVQAWDEPGGPGIVKTLLKEKQVSKVANAKAYEMLSNLVGLCDFARVTGDPSLIQASLNAWQDIVEKRLYVTGATSQWEHFQADHDMRGDVRAHVGETCVTTTWIQFNLSLLQLTGEARFGDELERAFYNHLTAAQHPRGDDWAYYTPQEGRKQYDAGITCCHSSGPRGLALAPQAAYLRSHDAKGKDVLLISTFESSRATLKLGGQEVTAELASGFPYKGEATLTLRMARPASFALKLRMPAWAQPMTLAGATAQQGWLVLPARRWKDGDTLPLSFSMASRLKSGEYTQAGRAALAWGPFVLAYDQDSNAQTQTQAKASLPPGHLLRLTRPARLLAPQAGQPLSFQAEVESLVSGAAPSTASSTAPKAAPQTARFLTFADAGAQRGVFRIWLRAPGADAPGADESLLIGGQESRSRGGAYAGLAEGSIIDEDFESLATTFDGQAASEDWFAVTLPRPVTARRIVFTHGKNFHDGGWFDTALGGKPRVQVQRQAGAAWETVGELDQYPATTATKAADLERWWADARFTLQLKTPLSFVAVRVIGKPAGGDQPAQAFASCTELQAYAQ